MSANDLAPTPAEIFIRGMDSRLLDVFTAGPGIVQSYDPATQCADILPGIKRPIDTEDGDTVSEDLPVIPNVRVCFPRGGGFAITWPLSTGDEVVLLHCHLSPSAWREGDGTPQAPIDLRLHGLGSVFALPMLCRDSRAVSSAQASQNAFVVSGPLVVLGDSGASDFAALSSKVDANFQKIVSLFSIWTPTPNDGGAALKTASSGLSFGTTACAKVKIS